MSSLKDLSPLPMSQGPLAAQPCHLMCEHPNCDNSVSSEEKYVRLETDLPNGWGSVPEFLCLRHAKGRTPVDDKGNPRKDLIPEEIDESKTLSTKVVIAVILWIIVLAVALKRNLDDLKQPLPEPVSETSSSTH